MNESLVEADFNLKLNSPKIKEIKRSKSPIFSSETQNLPKMTTFRAEVKKPLLPSDGYRIRIAAFETIRSCNGLYNGSCCRFQTSSSRHVRMTLLSSGDFGRE